MDDSTITQFSYYNDIFRRAVAYDINRRILSGKKSTIINATKSFNLLNNSSIYMNTGEIIINADNILIEDSDIVNKNILSMQDLNGIELNAKEDILINNSSV